MERESCDARSEQCPDGKERFDVHDPHELGRLGEELAAQYAAKRGFSVLERNYRTPYGEADLVCRHGKETVLIEVKTRMGGEAFPEDAVDGRKIRRYRKITLHYLGSHEDDEQVRFDVMAINVVSANTARAHHYVGVCSWEG